jgi:hypothetical protein
VDVSSENMFLNRAGDVKIGTVSSWSVLDRLLLTCGNQQMSDHI